MWFLFPQLVWANPKSRLIRSPRSTRMADYALAIQRPELNVVKREKCEADLDELPAEEPDVFDKRLASRGIGGACAAREFVEARFEAQL